MATYKQEKEASQTTFTNKVLDVPKNRWDAARKEKLDRKKRLLDSRTGSQPPSPSLSAMGTPRLGAAPTSVPLSEDEVRLKAMRKPLVHLLATGPKTKEEIRSKTHIPKDDLDLILQKVGKQVDGMWQLSERAYKELDVWSFGYPSKDDRQSTIDNAIRAYDRLRLGKDDNLWQLLLPKEERGKGKVLSRLHLNGGVGAPAKSSLTPHYQPSPAPHVNSGEDKVASAANTPRLGSSTPRLPNSKGDVMKRLLSKDPSKAHRIEEAKMKKSKAAEEAREKKRKEKEDAASDKEGKRPAKRPAITKKANPKVKSADIVHSSDDESGEDGEVKERPNNQSKPPPAAKKKATAASSTSPEESSDAGKPIKEVKKTVAKAKPTPTPTTTKTSASPAVKASKPTTGTAAGKNTPQTTNGLSAPSSQAKPRSPSGVGSRPGVPSPLGAARPRVASDVSDRSAVGVQRVRQGAETPRGLGITNGVKKRADTVTSRDGATPGVGVPKPKDRTSSDKSQKPSANGIATPKANATTPKPEAGTKRKASDPPASSQQEPKHRKTASSSSLTLSATNSSSTSNNTAGPPTLQTSPDASGSGSSSDNSAVLDTISYKTGVNQAEKFREHFYPAYIALYDEVEAAQRRGEPVGREKVEQLRKMHGRLVEMKREIEAASRRERGEE